MSIDDILALWRAKWGSEPVSLGDLLNGPVFYVELANDIIVASRAKVNSDNFFELDE